MTGSAVDERLADYHRTVSRDEARARAAATMLRVRGRAGSLIEA